MKLDEFHPKLLKNEISFNFINFFDKHSSASKLIDKSSIWTISGIISMKLCFQSLGTWFHCENAQKNNNSWIVLYSTSFMIVFIHKWNSLVNSIHFSSLFSFFSISIWNYTTIKFLYQFSLEWNVFNLLIKWMKIELFFCFIQYVFNNNRNSMQPKKNKNSSFFLAQNILNTLEIKTEYSFVLQNFTFFMIKDYF